MKLLSIVGARPQFVKLAPLAQAAARRQRQGLALEHRILHTGQHYDASMSDVFFDELELPRADVNLQIGSGPHGRQTGLMLGAIEQALLELRPDAAIVYGDTNSTLAGALAAAKLHIPVAHVEAGLRSGNRRMPEEINRLVADHVCGLLLAPTARAGANLAAEGLASRTRVTGDLMYDAVLRNRRLAARRSRIGQRLSLAPRGYAVATVHRADNTDDPAALARLLRALARAADDGMDVVFPVHPRTAQRIGAALPGWSAPAGLKLTEPVGYLDMLWLIEHAAIVLTDSGGVQREAFFLGRPCVTLRGETEWEETVLAGANILAGDDPSRIAAAIARLREHPAGLDAAARRCFGDGDAAERILEAVLAFAAQPVEQSMAASDADAAALYVKRAGAMP